MTAVHSALIERRYNNKEYASMKPSSTRVALAIAAAMLVLMLVDAAIFGFHSGSPELRTAFAEFLTASVLAYAMWAARGHGWRLVAAAFLPLFVARYVNTLDEGVFYVGLPATIVVGGLVIGLLSSAVATVVLVWMMGKMRATGHEAAPPRAARPVGAWLWRLAAGDFAYICLYWAAGLCVIPFTKNFYAQFALPSPGAIVLMQVFRGLLYIGAVLPLARMIPERRHAAIVLGLALSILGGAVPLLPDNALMPPNIRFAHFIEIGVSNFLYGVILAYLFSPPAKPAASSAMTEGQAVTS
jgi:hypothetical protein